MESLNRLNNPRAQVDNAKLRLLILDTGAKWKHALLQSPIQPLFAQVMQTVPVTQTQEFRMSACKILAQADAAIVFSPLAAKLLLRITAGNEHSLPQKILAMGPETARVLQVTRCPISIQHQGSDALIQAAQSTGMNCWNRAVLIGGYNMRPALKLYLKSTGVDVQTLHLYRRVPVPADRQLYALLNAHLDCAQALICNNITALRLLIYRTQQLDSANLSALYRLPVIAASERISQIVRHLGFTPSQPLAEGAAPVPMVQAAVHAFRQLQMR
ncbi:MAG: uroporphyrinogen-III synthase [Gammaproteobacteria bacterium]